MNQNENSILYDAKKKQFRGIINGKPFIIEDRGAFLLMINEEKIEILKLSDFKKFLENFGFFYIKEE